MTAPPQAARALAPRAAELAAQGEAERRLPVELSFELAAAGLYRLCVPASLGGGEAPPAELLEAVEALAARRRGRGLVRGRVRDRGDARRVPRARGGPRGLGRAVRRRRRRVRADGPRGRGGRQLLSVGGRWRFCSNVANCDWLMGGCVVADGGAPRLLESGRPDIRLVLMPAADVEVIDTWTVSGLRGDRQPRHRGRGARRAGGPVGLADHRPAARARPALRVPAVRAAGGGDRRGRRSGSRAGRSTIWRSSPGPRPHPEHPQARRARRDPVRSSPAPRPPCARRARSCTRARVRLGRGGRRGRDPGRAARWAAARLDPRGRGRGRGRRRRLVARGRQRDLRDGPLQRRFRDVHAATQHMLVGPATWELTGRSLLGPRVRRLAALRAPARSAGALVGLDPGRDPVEAALGVRLVALRSQNSARWTPRDS